MYFILLLVHLFCVIGNNNFVNGRPEQRSNDEIETKYRHDFSQRQLNLVGSCELFKRKNLNLLDKCCINRDDDCYVEHYDTRCYCDSFCIVSNDCCEDFSVSCKDLANYTAAIAKEAKDKDVITTTTERNNYNNNVGYPGSFINTGNNNINFGTNKLPDNTGYNQYSDNRYTTSGNDYVRQTEGNHNIIVNVTPPKRSTVYEDTYKHENEISRVRGGLCFQFAIINKKQGCCKERNDGCFMEFFRNNTRCFCDSYCNQNPNDCCPDYKNFCV